MASLAKGLAVIRAFEGRKKQLTISQISHHTGFSRASVMRCLYTLTVLGYVEVKDNMYSLLPRILTLGHAYLSSSWLATTAQPWLDRLSEKVYAASSLAMLEDIDILYIARAAIPDRIISVDLAVGSRLPAYCTSIGKVLLSELPAEKLANYFQKAILQARTKHTVYQPDKISEQLKKIREQGWVIVEQEYENSLRSIAAPIRDANGYCIAAINISTNPKQVSKQRLENEFLPLLLDTCQCINISIYQNNY